MAFAGPVISGETAAGVATPIRVSATGQLEIGSAVGSAGYAKLEDAAAASGDMGVFTLGVRAPATPVAATSAAGDYGAFLVDAEGKTIVDLHAAPELTRQGRVDFTAITDLPLLTAGAAGIRTYITDLTVENTGAAAARFLLRDGTTTIWSCTVPAGSTLVRSWGTALRGTAATAWNGQLGAAGTVTVSVSGFSGV